MKIKLIQTGKTHFKNLEESFELYAKRIRAFCPFEAEEIVLPARFKTSDPDRQMEAEKDVLLKKIQSNDFLVLLDDKGKSYTSKAFAAQLNQWSLQYASVVFVIGGAYGFDPAVYQRANAKMSLSEFTFSHQLVRLIFSEQVYRAFCILNNHPYHHE